MISLNIPSTPIPVDYLSFLTGALAPAGLTLGLVYGSLCVDIFLSKDSSFVFVASFYDF